MEPRRVLLKPELKLSLEEFPKELKASKRRRRELNNGGAAAAPARWLCCDAVFHYTPCWFKLSSAAETGNKYPALGFARGLNHIRSLSFQSHLKFLLLGIYGRPGG